MVRATLAFHVLAKCFGAVLTYPYHWCIRFWARKPHGSSWIKIEVQGIAFQLHYLPITASRLDNTVVAILNCCWWYPVPPHLPGSEILSHWGFRPHQNPKTRIIKVYFEFTVFFEGTPPGLSNS
jgi:hypothetical protein